MSDRSDFLADKERNYYPVLAPLKSGTEPAAAHVSNLPPLPAKKPGRKAMTKYAVAVRNKRILELLASGAPADAVARRYDLTRASIKRIVRLAKR